jgi:hypothetical protein
VTTSTTAQSKVDECKGSDEASSHEQSYHERTYEGFLKKRGQGSEQMTQTPQSPLSPVDLKAFDYVVAEARLCLERKKRAEKALRKEQEAFKDKLRELEGFAKYDNNEKIKEALERHGL